jgi:hypothetical protein
MLYGNDELVAEGTVLDLTSLGWRLSGSMSVVPGMQLTLQVSIPERTTPLRIQRATVLWVKDHEFAIEAHEMTPVDHAWVDGFLRQKLGLVWMSRNADHETSVHTTEEMSHRETTDSTAGAGQARGDGDLNLQQWEDHTSYDALPETILFEARRIIRRILALKAARARTGLDPIANN